MADVITREAVPQQARWNQESLFATPQDWQTSYDSLRADVPRLDPFPGTLGDPEQLIDFMNVSTDLMRCASMLYFYGMMNGSVDSSDDDAKEKSGQAMSLFSQITSKTAFSDPELLGIGQETLMGWADRYPDLSVYRHYFDNLLRRTDHVQSPDVEALLSRFGQPASTLRNTRDELTQNDIDFPDATGSDGGHEAVTQSNSRILLQSADREVCRTAWNSLQDMHITFANTLASNYNASVQMSVVTAQARGYDTVLESQLDRHNLPTAVFHTLVDTCRKHVDLWHRYWDVRRRLLGVDELHPHDTWASLTSEPLQLSWDEAVTMLCDGLAPLGDEYVSTVRRGITQERWVDYVPNRGKRLGAFSGGTYDTHPFIMMSYDGTALGLGTLAHEVGHSMHSYFSRREQPYVYSGYSMFVAEVASNFNQALLRAHLLDRFAQDRNALLSILDEAMANFYRYFLVMPSLARLEYAAHSRVEQGKPLNAPFLNQTMGDAFADAYGDSMVYDRERVAITWATFQHLYVPYYTFQYATGISAAHALAQPIADGDVAARDRYLAMLQAGSSVYPMEVLKQAGVDLTTADPIEQTFATLSRYVDQAADAGVVTIALVYFRADVLSC